MVPEMVQDGSYTVQMHPRVAGAYFLQALLMFLGTVQDGSDRVPTCSLGTAAGILQDFRRFRMIPHVSACMRVSLRMCAQLCLHRSVCVRTCELVCVWERHRMVFRMVPPECVFWEVPHYAHYCTVRCVN